MKCIMICYGESIDEEILEILEKAGTDGYTKFTRILGEGSSSDPHLYTHVWPKANNVIMTVVSEELAVIIMDKIRDMKSSIGGKESLKAFSWQIDSMT